MIEFVVRVPAVSYTVPAPVIEDVTPSPSVTFAAPVPVIEFVAPAPADAHSTPVFLRRRSRLSDELTTELGSFIEQLSALAARMENIEKETEHIAVLAIRTMEQQGPGKRRRIPVPPILEEGTDVG